MISTNYQHEPCPVCKSAVHGRIDKRYCSTKCKNKHHNTSRRMNKPMTMEVNRQLLRNLTVLEGLLMDDSAFLRIHQTALVRLGFVVESVTGFQIKGRTVVHYCYHFAYTISNDGIVNVRRLDKVNTVLPGFYERWEIDFPKKGKSITQEKASDDRSEGMNSLPIDGS